MIDIRRRDRKTCRLLAALLCQVLGGLVACSGALAPETNVSVWAAPEGFKIDRFGTKVFTLDKGQHVTAVKERNRLWDSATKRITLSGARGETLAFQLGIEGGDAGLRAVDVRPSALTGQHGVTLLASQFDLFKIYYTEVSDRGSGPTNGPTMGQGWYPDALVPWVVRDTDAYGGYDGPPFAIRPREIQGVWIDVAIPYGTPAGDYTGTLTVSSDRVQAALGVVLHVLDFDLPRKIHNTFFMNFGIADLNQAGGQWLAGDRLVAYEDEVYRLARRHRFTAGNMYDTDFPTIEETHDGMLKKVDWRAYDTAHDKVLNPRHNLYGPGEDPVEIWKVPLSTGISSGGNRVPGGDKAWDQMVTEVVKHWQERNWDLSRAYVYLSDEPSPEFVEVIDSFARRVKALSGGALRRQVAVNGRLLGERWSSQQATFDRWRGNLDMWLVSGSNYSVPEMNALPLGSLKGMYQGGEPYQGNETLDADGVAMRSWSWIAWQYRIDYLCYYSMSEAWRKAVPDPRRRDEFYQPPGRAGYNNDNEIWDHPRTRPWGVSQGVFIYPGKKVNCDLPIVNIRMKQIRRGQTDFEYFWLLRHAGEGALADRLVKSVVNVALSEAADRPEWFGYGKWTHNPDDWDAAVARAATRLVDLRERLPKEPASR